MNFKQLKFVGVLAILLSINSFAQTDSSSRKQIKYTCESGTEQAIQDANKGIYKSITYGLVASTDWDFDKFYWKFAKAKYNIILGTGGCVVNDEILCYSRKMKSLIDDKFGEGFLDKVKKEARLAYGKTKNTK